MPNTMRVGLCTAFAAMLAACNPSGESPVTSGVPSPFDGAYSGTVAGVSPAVCGEAGNPLTVNITNGRLRLSLPSGSNLTARVNADGSISSISFVSATNEMFTSSGSGQISNNQMRLNLETLNPRFRGPCNFIYTAAKNI